MSAAVNFRQSISPAAASPFVRRAASSDRRPLHDASRAFLFSSPRRRNTFFQLRKWAYFQFVRFVTTAPILALRKQSAVCSLFERQNFSLAPAPIPERFGLRIIATNLAESPNFYLANDYCRQLDAGKRLPRFPFSASKIRILKPPLKLRNRP